MYTLCITLNFNSINSIKQEINCYHFSDKIKNENMKQIIK